MYGILSEGNANMAKLEPNVPVAENDSRSNTTELNMRSERCIKYPDPHMKMRWIIYYCILSEMTVKIPASEFQKRIIWSE